MLEPSSQPAKPGDNESQPADVRANDSRVIVVEYRQRGLLARLMPPALILVLALAISSYQRSAPLRPLAPRIDLNALARNAAEPAAPAPPPKVVFRSDTGTSPDTENTPKSDSPSETPPDRDVRREAPAARVDEGRAPKDSGPSTTLAAARTSRSSLFELDPDAGLEAIRPAAVVALPVNAAERAPREAMEEPERAAGPGPAPSAASIVPDPGAPDVPPGREEPAREQASRERGDLASREEILRDIQREADEKGARRDEIERIKPQAGAMLFSELLAKVQEERMPFRNELRQLLAQWGDSAGRAIDELCDNYGREPLPEVRRAYSRARRTSSTRMSRQATVDLLRSIGLPEPAILDYLAHDLHKHINTRGGPRDEDEVRVRAARLLLSLPLPTSRRPSAEPVAVPSASPGGEASDALPRAAVPRTQAFPR
jgi:hypothetical protein